MASITAKPTDSKLPPFRTEGIVRALRLLILRLFIVVRFFICSRFGFNDHFVMGRSKEGRADGANLQQSWPRFGRANAANGAGGIDRPARSRRQWKARGGNLRDRARHRCETG